jgi:hypothetical protein
LIFLIREKWLIHHNDILRHLLIQIYTCRIVYSDDATSDETWNCLRNNSNDHSRNGKCMICVKTFSKKAEKIAWYINWNMLCWMISSLPQLFITINNFCLVTQLWQEKSLIRYWFLWQKDYLRSNLNFIN